MSTKPTLGSIAISILLTILIWDMLFFMVNALVSAFDFRSFITRYDAWFLQPVVDFFTSLYGWMTTIIGNASALVFLIIISYIYDLTEAEWEPS